MRVAILGAGAAAYALAVFARREGHDPVLWSPSGRRTQALSQRGSITAVGAVEGEFPVTVAADCEQAIAGAKVVVLALPAMGHRSVIDRMLPHLEAGQVVIFSAHLSFAALYLERGLTRRGLSLPIVTWSTTLLRSRQPDLTSVRIATVRQLVDMAVLPVSAQDEGLAACRDLFGDRFRAREDLLAITLSNINPQSHMALSLCNFTRMELGEEWDQARCSTEAVARLAAQLDAERLEVAERFGVNVRSVAEHREQTHGKDAGAPTVRTFGPATTDTRYVVEDVPFGLLPLTVLASVCGVETPFHRMGLSLFSALYGRDFALENDLLPELGLETMSVDAIRDLCRLGEIARTAA